MSRVYVVDYGPSERWRSSDFASTDQAHVNRKFFETTYNLFMKQAFQALVIDLKNVKKNSSKYDGGNFHV